MQKLPTKLLANSNNLNLKQIIESQKTQQNKLRKLSGNRLMMINNNPLKSTKDKPRKSTANMKNSQIQSDQSFLKLKIKQNSKGAQSSLRGEYFNTDIIVGHDNYRNDDTIQRKGYNIDEELKVEEYNASQSPKYHDEYHLLGQGETVVANDFNADYDDEYQELEQHIKIPNFLGRTSLDPKEKNQFYMTQIINHSRQIPYQHSNSNVPSKQPNSLVSSNLKLPRSKLKNSKITQSVNKSQIVKNLQNKQVSPMIHHECKVQNQNEFQNYKSLVNNQEMRTQKRKALNTSALITSSRDFLNSTAPINMHHINKLYKEEAIQQGFSDAVNSTQNLKRFVNKEQQEEQLNFSSYYSGAIYNKTIKSGIHSKHSVSPMKAAKKQLLIQNILSQENKTKGPNSKYFLNLTLQQLIQQQHQENINEQQTLQRKQQFVHQTEDIQTMQKNKRLNKTLDSNQYSNNTYSSYDNSSAQVKIRSKLSQINVQNTLTQQPKQVKNLSQKKKFSSTMRISDFNQTQIFDTRHVIGGVQQIEPGRKSKNSLKSTQNLNFHDEGNQRKASAMSTYSMNTAQTTTTHNMTKNKRIVNISNVNDQQNVAKVQHKRQGSQDKDLMKKIMNFYQDDFFQHYNTQDQQKNPSISKQKLGIQKSQTKHKANSTLNQYLHNQINGPVDVIKGELELGLLSQTPNPYAQTKTKKQGLRKELISEIQNKTQPIPKTLLEIAQAQAINLSTGTSIICNINNKIPSKDSIGYNGKSKTRPSKSRTKKLDEEVKVTIQPQVVKPKIGRRKDIEIAKDVIKEDDPVEIYNNRNTILIDGMDGCDADSKGQDSKLERFILGKQIGQGAYAVVRVAVNKKDNKKYAIKIYDKSKLTDTNRQRSVRREIKLLQKMNHQNIVKIFEAFETEHHVYLVMEYVVGGSLHSYLKDRPNRRLDEEEAKRIFKQILTALQYCHRKSIAHRDIKLENILLDENKNVKLIDFGFSTCIPNDKKIKMFCGTPSYMAPEIVLKEEYAGPPADIWASAVLLYALMNGCFPFRGATDKELYRRIQRGTYIMHNDSVTGAFQELLQRLINIKADERPTSDQVLQDNWFMIDSNQEIVKNHEDSIADQKRQFKAKILGKIPVEKTKNTICLNSSQEQNRNIQFRGNSANINLGNVNANFQGNQNMNTANINNDFSDYGLQQQNVMKKLNQEAYQAYYNTSGSIGANNGNSAQNPYYNNFFQNNNFTANIQNPNSAGFYPNPNSFPMRGSPGKTNPAINTSFPINFNQHQPNQIGTPQVFGSPTGFHCNAGTINNNFNIINNITQVTCLSPPSDLNSQQTQQQKQCSSDSSNRNNIIVVDNKLDVDEEIVNSITKMGYHRSHVVSQLENDSSNITHIYTKLKEEKMSQTQNRPLSLQPQRRINIIGKGQHNNGIFPNFVPSIPDSLKGYGDENRMDRTNYYYEQNDYVVMSPKQNENRSLS